MLKYTLLWGQVSNLTAIMDDDSGKQYSYKYNDQGIRTEKVVNGVTHKYYLQGEQMIAERYGSNLIKYYYDATGICGFNYNGYSYYYRKNMQGDIIAIYDGNGVCYATYAYDAWGRFKIFTNINDIANINPFRYRGYYYDKETSLYYLNARYYDPEICRFISPDSTEYLKPESINGLNLYAYCLNNPVMNIDPDGHVVLSLIIAAVVGAAVAALGSIVSQLLTTGTVSWGQVGISAIFGAVGGLLSFTGVGGIIGQFFIQGLLGVGELYSIAALNGTVSSIGIEEVVATFLFAGGLGAIGAGGAAKEFKRIGQIEADFLKYSLRDIKRSGKPIFQTILTRGSKYFKSFLIPTIKQGIISGGINTIVNIFDYWAQKGYNYFK